MSAATAWRAASFKIELKYRSFLKKFRIVETPIIFEDRKVGQSKMSQIGVKVEIVNGLEVTNEMAKAGDWELQLYGGYPVQDPNALVQPLACSNIGTEIQENGYAWGGSNYTNYCNAELDALMEEAKTLSDQDARAALYAQAQDIFLDEVPIMINYIGANAFAWASDLQGVTIYGDPS